MRVECFFCILLDLAGSLMGLNVGILSNRVDISLSVGCLVGDFVGFTSFLSSGLGVGVLKNQLGGLNFGASSNPVKGENGFEWKSWGKNRFSSILFL